MPLLRKSEFIKVVEPENARDDQEVFFCKMTKEVFSNYDDYFERVMLLNSLVWTCSFTGRINLTYAEALQSEKSSRKSLNRFPKELKIPIILVTKLTKRSGINRVIDDVFTFMNVRFLKHETVMAVELLNNKEMWRECQVIDVIAPSSPSSQSSSQSSSSSSSTNGNKPIDPKKIKYKVKRINSELHKEQWTVLGDKIRRPRSIITKDKLKMLLRQYTTVIDGILTVTDESYKKLVANESLTKFEDYFVGKPPTFGITLPQKRTSTSDGTKLAKNKRKSTENTTPNKKKINSAKNNNKNVKQQSIAKYLTKDANQVKEKEAVAKELLKKQELLAKKAEELRVEMALEREQQRLKFLNSVQTTVKFHNQIRDDLELQDQKPLASAKSIKTLIPLKYFGDAIMVLEFMHSFSFILADKDKFSGGINLQTIERAVLCREVAGPLSDILQVLLCTIFKLKMEETYETNIKYVQTSKNVDAERNPIEWNVKNATKAAHYAKRYFSTDIEELPMDALTVSELLRLHLLMSGAMANDVGTRWRYQERGGYRNTDDPGFRLRMTYPHIIRTLSTYTIYQLPIADIFKILKCLMSQILSYSSVRDVIDNRYHSSNQAKIALKTLHIQERRREISVTTTKKEILDKINKGKIEFIHKVMGTPSTTTSTTTTTSPSSLSSSSITTTVGNSKAEAPTAYTLAILMKGVTILKPDEQRLIEEFNKVKQEEYESKIAKIDKQSEIAKRLFEKHLRENKQSIFAYQAYLGSDRAYRSYWLYESLPGIFIQHEPFGGKCLDNPVKNIHGLAHCTSEKRYHFIKKMLGNDDANDKQKQSNQSTAVTNNTKITPSNNNNNNNNNNNTSNTMPINQLMDSVNGKMENSSYEHLTQADLLMCTGNQFDCPVHNQAHPKRIAWSFLHTDDEINNLIESLNVRGIREKNLREQIENEKQLILDHIRDCPIDRLHIETDTVNKQLFNEMMNMKKYIYGNMNYEHGQDMSVILSNEIRNNILEMEDAITRGHLGTLKVKNRMEWRAALENLTYDMQCDLLEWGPHNKYHKAGKLMLVNGNGGGGGPAGGSINGTKTSKKLKINLDNDKKITNGPITNNSINNINEDKQNDDNVITATVSHHHPDSDNNDDSDDEFKEFEDPAIHLGNTQIIELDDSIDECTPIHKSPEIEEQVHNYASAILQIAQSIEPQYLKAPFGVNRVVSIQDVRLKEGIENLKWFTVSLMNATSYSQVCLHYNILHDAVKWQRSSTNAKCNICRRGNDPDKIILCDGCNSGQHIYCLKPKILSVPKGDYFCTKCKPPEIEIPLPKTVNRKREIFRSDNEDNEDTSDFMENDIVNQSSHNSSDSDWNMCDICDADGQHLLKCTVCQIHMHLKCAKLSVKERPRFGWKCNACKTKSSHLKTRRQNKTRSRKAKDSDSEDVDTDDSDIPIAKKNRKYKAASSRPVEPVNNSGINDLQILKKIKSKSKVNDSSDIENNNSSRRSSRKRSKLNMSGDDDDAPPSTGIVAKKTKYNNSNSKKININIENDLKSSIHSRLRRNAKSIKNQKYIENTDSSDSDDDDDDDQDEDVDDDADADDDEEVENEITINDDEKVQDVNGDDHSGGTRSKNRKRKNNKYNVANHVVVNGGGEGEDLDNESKQNQNKSKIQLHGYNNNNNNNDDGTGTVTITEESNDKYYKNSKVSSRRSRRIDIDDDLLLNVIALQILLVDIGKHDDSWPFMRPVKRIDIPDYYEIIKKPMDFATIKSKLNLGKYTTNFDIINDIQQIFLNCDLYNRNGSEIYNCGLNLEKYIKNRCNELHLPFQVSDMQSSISPSSISTQQQQQQHHHQIPCSKPAIEETK